MTGPSFLVSVDESLFSRSAKCSTGPKRWARRQLGLCGEQSPSKPRSQDPTGRLRHAAHGTSAYAARWAWGLVEVKAKPLLASVLTH